MTVKELSLAIKSIIDEYDFFDVDKFFTSANMALGVIFSEIDCVGRASVYLSVPAVLERIERLRHSGGTAEEIPLHGVAYSMRLFGKGTVEINDGTSTVSYAFDGRGKVIRGRISNGGSLRFLGELAYTVKDLTFFSETEGTELCDIPVLGEKRTVKISDYISDFSRALSHPCDKNGHPVKGVDIENGYIICPDIFEGDICFSYRKRAPVLSSDAYDEEISIPTDAEAALTMLTAAYFLGEAETDAAEFFLKEYKRYLCYIGKNSAPSRAEPYFDAVGWA